MTECPHFGRPLDFPGECTLCSGADAKLKADQAAVAALARRTFAAKWPGQCGVCNLPITVGQTIAWREGQPVVHAECEP